MKMVMKVPFHKPALLNGEEDAVREVLKSGWLTSGAWVDQSERDFAEYLGARHAIAVNSCTAALHLALVANDVGPGDEVVVPAMTFAATAEVVEWVGATPIIVDVLSDTLCIDPEAVEASLTHRTRAVIAVHYGGQAVELDRLRSICHAHDVCLIEDAAHAFPTTSGGRPVGRDSTAACFSFYANKTITTGEGGMFVTQDDSVAERVRRLRLHGLSRDAWRRWETGRPWDYSILEPGFKYNMSDVAAAMGVKQLAIADDLATRRRHIATVYDEVMPRLGVEPVTVESLEASSCHLYVIRLPNAHPGLRDRAIAEMGDRGVGTSVHYRPLHMHPFYQERYGLRPEDAPVASAQFDVILSLPIYPTMSETEISWVVDSLSAALASE
jgi:dTDP-4-amino-4,6-dideoxygalactose transaminase